MDWIFSLIETYKDHFGEIPLDIRGSEFQQLVWRALREIPYGNMATYSEIAKKSLRLALLGLLLELVAQTQSPFLFRVTES